MKNKTKNRIMSLVLSGVFAVSTIQLPVTSYANELENAIGSAGSETTTPSALLTSEATTPSVVTVEEINGGYHLSNGVFDVMTGEYGQITSLKIVGDKYPTNYVMNQENSAGQDTSEHQWMGELMFKTKLGDSAEWVESMTQSSSSGRNVELIDNKVVVTYENATEERGIQNFKLVETYSLEGEKLRWEIKIINTNDEKLTVGDLGLPLAFNERWPGGEEIYETRTVDHSFVAKDSSYIYATRPSGLGQFLLLTPDTTTTTGSGFEYQDLWRVEERRAEEKAWCQDQNGWPSGLNVFYIHSDVIKSTNRGYLKNTSLVLEPQEEKTYAFNFTVAQNEMDMKSTLYEEGLIDAVAVPGMTFAKNMPAKMYLHTKASSESITFDVKCPHENGLHEGNPKTISNNLPCNKAENTHVTYLETKMIDGEQYHIYDISFSDLGQNNVIVNYDGGKQTILQFYIMDSVEGALETHADFMVDKTQWNAPGEFWDKVFDDWMMDTKSKRGEFKGYWGWGDDWGLTHGQYLAEKNVYQPVEKQIKALDEYLDVAIWNSLMREHQEDYKIHDFLMPEPNDTPLYRGYAYPHIYNTYFSMYKIASKYPEMITYKETGDTYLMRAYNIMKALYGEGVAYNWETGVMGELTTPDIIAALDKEGYYEEAQTIRDIMAKKYANFKNAKYPYGSEYSYDNTGEEAVYTLAKVNKTSDSANAQRMMSAIDAKTRACRGVQPVWYHYANPTTICGESWWNFQYTASLAGYAMDDWLRLQNNGMDEEAMSEAARVNYAAKLANLTAINSGQIDADPENIGTVSWTYQSHMGNMGGQGTGGGDLHNGWRQMAGEADLGLFGAMQILSSDVTVDPVFGLFGYGCNVTDKTDTYDVTPLDGLYTKLNFINEKLSIELGRDQYTQAIVKKDKSSVVLNVKNLEATAHETDIELTGLKEGFYNVSVGGTVTDSFQVINGQTAIGTAILPAATAATVTIQEGSAPSNTAPVVNAGQDQETYLSDDFRLEGKATDDGFPNMTLSSTWSVVGKPEESNPVFKNGDKIITKVTFDKSGTYEFKLDVSDGEGSSSDTVKVIVKPDLPVPAQLAHYTFDNIDTVNQLVKDESGEGYDARLMGNPKLSPAKTDNGNGVSMDGSVSGYIKLPTELTKGVKEATIVLDVKLNAVQVNSVRLFEFGDMEDHYFYVSFENGNELVLNVTNLATGTQNKVNTGVVLAPNYWKNIAVTLKENTAIVYVDGIEKAKLENCEFNFAGLSEVQRNYIGRSYEEKIPFLNGIVDNFNMKSTAMTAAELLVAYGSNEVRTIISSVETSIVTTVGKAPILPEKVKVLYSDGTYEQANVAWNTVPASDYEKAGTFKVTGVVADTEISTSIVVIVASGTIQNLAESAEPTAIVNTPQDLGGVAGLNDGYEPTGSGDTSHGVWHNWLGGAQGAPAWVQYTWDNEVVLTGIDAYYFMAGNFAPSSVKLEYLNAEGVWVQVTNAKGLGVELDKYNTTSFDPIATKALKMTMTPKTLGIGVIEWKAYGYSDKEAVDKRALNTGIALAKGLNKDLFTSGWEALQTVLTEADLVSQDKNATPLSVSTMTSQLNKAIAGLKPVDDNIAYNANALASYVSSWEKLAAVNDGAVSEKSDAAGLSAKYGTWGNESDKEIVTYTWVADMNITGTELFIWTDGGGIKIPQSYQYEYMDKEGNWTPVQNATGYEKELDKFNVTTFDPITTRGFRVILMKQATDGEGVGLIEWKVNGKYVPAIEANKAALQDAITLAETKAQGDYTAESWAVLAKSLTAAKTVNTDGKATQEQVNTAQTALQTAINGLEKKPVVVDKAALQAAIKEAEAKVQADYTAESWAVLAKSLTAAKTVNTDGKATQEQVKAAQTALQTAINGLEKKPVVVDKAALQAAIKEAEAKVQADYTAESWAVLAKALTTAKTVNTDGKATQEQVKAAQTALQTAINGLEKKPVVVDKAALQAAIKEAEAKVQADYTAESWAVLAKSLTAAKTVNTDGKATQEQVKAAQTALQTAITGLAKYSTSGSSGSSTPSQTNNTPKKEEPQPQIHPQTITPPKDNNDKEEVVKISLSLANGTVTGTGTGTNNTLLVKPYIQNNRTMVGVRDMTTLLNVENKNVVWNAKDKSIVIQTEGIVIKLFINQKYAIVNGKKIALDVAPQVKDGRTVLPVAHIAHLLNIQTQFDAKTKQIIFSIKR